MNTAADPHPARAGALAVLVAEADPRARQLLRWLLDHDDRFRVVEELACGDDVAAYPDEVDLLVLDLTIPGLNAFEAAQRFRAAHPSSAVVVLAPVDSPYLRDAMQAAGADGYVVTATPDRDVVDRVAAFASPPVL